MLAVGLALPAAPALGDSEVPALALGNSEVAAVGLALPAAPPDPLALGDSDGLALDDPDALAVGLALPAAPPDPLALGVADGVALAVALGLVTGGGWWCGGPGWWPKRCVVMATSSVKITAMRFCNQAWRPIVLPSTQALDNSGQSRPALPH